MICSRCNGGKCADEPTQASPLWMKCSACVGDDPDCESCGGRGQIKIDSCPSRMVDGETWNAVRMAEFAKHGSWPVAGGTLDQTESFMDAAAAVWSESSYWRAKLKLRESDG